MTKTFKEIIAGIRTAIYGREVREDIAQGMEYVEGFADTATQKAEAASNSAAAAENALRETTTAKTEAVQAIGEEKTASLDAIADAKTAALDDVASSTKTATDAAIEATKQAQSATDSANAAAKSQSASATSAQAAQTSAGEANAFAEKAAEEARKAANYVAADKTLSISGAPADAKTVGDALAGKADAVAPHLFTIPAAGWKDDTSVADFPHKLDISISGITATDIVNVVVSPDDTTVASDACFANTESLQGILRLRAKDVPTAAIHATWYIVR